MKKEFKFPAVKSAIRDYSGTIVVSANNEKAATAKLVKLMEGDDWKKLCSGELKDKDLKVEGKWRPTDGEREHGLHILDVVEKVDISDRLAICIKATDVDEDKVKGSISVTVTDTIPQVTGSFSVDWNGTEDKEELL